MLQTVAEPPYDGSKRRAIIGWTRKSIPAPKKAVAANNQVTPRAVMGGP